MNFKAICRHYNLTAVKSFWLCPITDLEEIYNGAGPDWMPKWGRETLSFFLRRFKGAFIIHDYDFAIADKTPEGFKKANKRMLKNFIIILNKDFPMRDFWHWHRRAYWWLKARLAYRACQKLGYSAWLDD